MLLTVVVVMPMTDAVASFALFTPVIDERYAVFFRELHLFAYIDYRELG
mgnify:CR=1 FL=1